MIFSNEYKLEELLKIVNLNEVEDLIYENNYVIVIVGYSGSGKSTLSNKFKLNGIPELLSASTREWRGSSDYMCANMDKSEFLGEDKFLAQDVIHNNIYGLKKHITNYFLNRSKVRLNSSDSVGIATYVTSPKGVYDFVNNIKGTSIKPILVKIDTDYDTLVERNKDRGVKRDLDLEIKEWSKDHKDIKWDLVLDGKYHPNISILEVLIYIDNLLRGDK